ncbi:MAG: class I SAM-dependent methyltransferase [Oligoflexia bacterium]|nr:class I SAM-dependent methyltransferase [Oligoflexia bacterium]
MQIVRGKKLETLEPEQFRALVGQFREVWIDVGTGDGKFVLDCARQQPEILVIGIDPAWNNLEKSSHRAAQKPAKGGASNALFVASSVEAIPAELRNLAARVFVNYPWGSLLRGVVEPQSGAIAALGSLLTAGGELELRLNYAVFETEADRAALAIPELTPDYLNGALSGAYQACGLSKFEWSHLPAADPVRSSWAKRLILGSARSTILIRARKS